MSGQVLAHVRRVLTGHSDRALIHAVDDAGLEYKLEVPAEAVRGVSSDRGFVLMVSWSLLALPRAAEPAAAAASTTPAEPQPAAAAPGSSPTLNAVDAEFIALMTRARRPAPEPTSPTATSGPGPEQQIAALLGLVPGRPT